VGFGYSAVEKMVSNSNQFWRNKRVLVTGHTGFKGSWLAMFLRNYGADVSGYSLSPSEEHLLWPLFENGLGVKSYYGDICDFENFRKVIQEVKPEIVFHLAAQPIVSQAFVSPLETVATNVIGTANILELFKNTTSVKTLVVVTSDKVYAHPQKSEMGFDEESPLGGTELYSASKASAELLTAAYRSAFKSEISMRSRGIATARAGNVLGGGDFGGNRLMPDIFQAIKTKTSMTLWNPNSVRPWQNVFDLCQGYLDLGQSLHLEPSNFDGAWNFANKSTSAKVIDLVEATNLVLKKLNRETLQFSIPAKSRDFKEEAELRIDSTKSEDLLGWHSRRDLATTISDTLNWYIKYMENPTFDAMFQYSWQECSSYIREIEDDRK
jgi:CDP-glucose 4,6-dehydratase